MIPIPMIEDLRSEIIPLVYEQKHVCYMNHKFMM